MQLMYGYVFAAGGTVIKVLATIIWIIVFCFAMIGWFTQISGAMRAREDAKKRG